MTNEELRIWVPVVVVVIGGLIALLLGALAFFFKRFYDSNQEGFANITKKLEEHRQELEDQIIQVEKDFLNFKAELPKNFVLKSDHFRNMTILENKIDEHGRDIKGMVLKLGSNESTLQKLCGQLEARDDH